ncbi:unnamed protein product [Moneuplotes crassus]|uniref:Rab-GAP TBC domain-containing protein n=1 Tax=Euplotes crassus TaxID=5936 RepID=A0AAD1UF39_EUPCR|nr:unnamed protein product [Moneuplotes crassus]
MDGETPPKRLSLALRHNKSECFSVLPICEPTTPTSCVTPLVEDEFDFLSFDSLTFEEHKGLTGCHKEIYVDELLKRPIPNSLVSQKSPSINFSFSNESSDSYEKGKSTFPKIKMVKRKVTKKDYKIGPKDKPLNLKNLKRIVFAEKLKESPFRCPCQKIEGQFCCFNAQEWINNLNAIIIKKDSFGLEIGIMNKINIEKYLEQKEVYESILKSSHDRSDSSSSSGDSFFGDLSKKKESVKTQILKDIPRTFSNLDIFGYASALQKLYRILYSCFIYDHQLGYTQGMNMVAGALLMHTEESIAFWLFITLLEDYDVRDVFTNTHESLKKHCVCIEKLLQHYHPVLANHMKQNDIRAEMFASGWVLSLFCCVIPAPFLHSFLTRFFKKKWSAFYSVCLSILAYLEPSIMKINDLPDFFEIYRELKLDQDFIKYEEKQYVDNEHVMDSLIKWRRILKNSETNYRGISSQLKKLRV